MAIKTDMRRVGRLRLGVICLVGILSSAALVSSADARKYDHIQTAALTYSTSQAEAAHFVASHYDMAINPSGGFYSTLKTLSPDIKCIIYVATTGFRTSSDYAALADFCATYGYNYDSMFLWVDNSVSRVGVQSITPAGGDCGSPSAPNTIYTYGGDTLEWCGWNQLRTAPDFRYEGNWDFIWFRYLRAMGTQFDGCMEDEVAQYYHPTWDIPASSGVFPWAPGKFVEGSPSNITGWGGMTRNAIRDSLLAIKRSQWLPRLMDTLANHGAMRWANTTNYGVLGSDVLDDQLINGMGAVLFENSLTPSGVLWNTEAWKVIDTLAKTPEAGPSVVWCTIQQGDSLALGSWARCQMERLVYFYMAANPDKFYFMLSGNDPWLLPNDYHAKDTAYKWFGAIEFDVGFPLAKRTVASSGTDPSGQGYTLYRRDYSNAVILYRMKTSTGATDNSSAVAYQLPQGGPYRELRVDGSLGPDVTSTTVRNAEGKIFIRASGDDSVPPGRIQDLGDAPGDVEGTIELTWTATGDDGYTGTATGYEIYYDLAPIDPGALYAAQFSTGPTPSPAGTAEAWTLTGLQPGYQYYIAIRAYDERGNRTELANFPFVFAGGIRTPAPLATSVDTLTASASLWCTIVPTYYADLEYTFEVDTTSGFLTPDEVPTVEVNDTAVLAMFSPVEQGYTYFWRCRASAAAKSENSNWSGYMAFNYNSGTTGALTTQHLATPGPGEIMPTATPTFMVNEVPNVSTVYIQIDDNPEFSSPLESGAVTAEPGKTTVWQIAQPLADGSEWRWRASADDILWTEPVRFTVLAGLVAGSDNLIPAHVYPNPFRVSETDFVTFTDVPEGANLAIMSVSGDLVRTWSNLSGGEFDWDGTTESGGRVASGVYLWFIENFDMKGKIVVIR